MKTKFLRISAILLMAMMVALCFLSAMAQSGNEKANTVENETDEAFDFEPEVQEEIAAKLKEVSTGIFEIESLREENVKHFRLEDGSYQAIIYLNPVHRKNAEGDWADIDNTLFMQTIDSVKSYTVSDGRIKFADTLSASSDLFSLNENGKGPFMAIAFSRTARVNSVIRIPPAGALSSIRWARFT